MCVCVNKISPSQEAGSSPRLVGTIMNNLQFMFMAKAQRRSAFGVISRSL